MLYDNLRRSILLVFLGIARLFLPDIFECTLTNKFWCPLHFIQDMITRNELTCILLVDRKCRSHPTISSSLQFQSLIFPQSLFRGNCKLVNLGMREINYTGNLI